MLKDFNLFPVKYSNHCLLVQADQIADILPPYNSFLLTLLLSGLGKEEQGMSSALQVEKTGRQRGVIVNESEERAKARIEISKQEEGRSGGIGKK